MVNAYETFPNLLAPIKIRGVMFRNKMFAAPLVSAEMIYDGQPSMETVMYLERKAMGGAAAVCFSGSNTDPFSSKPNSRSPMQVTVMGNYNFARAAADITRHGAVATLEMAFPGINSHGAEQLWGPVDMTLPNGRTVIAYTEERLLSIAEEHGKVALAAKNAGFGMVCLHGAHGSGLQQMMSPTMNTRTDQWGGSPENRCRLAVMSLQAIRRLCGPDFPIQIRISSTEVVKGEYEIDEGCRIAEQLDGYADIIDVSVSSIGRYGAETFARTHVSLFHPQGVNIGYAEAVKKHVSKSLVAGGGGLSDPYYMEEVLATGKADLIYIARGLVCDPDLPNKVKRGRPEEIRKCMRCLNCFGEGVSHGDLICAINPEISRERDVYRALPAPVKQRVLVIGGGIAGMQAALTANQFGHDVILCEKSGELGGKILCETEVPFKQRLHEYILLQRAKIAKTNIDLRLNTEVTPEYAGLQHPDVIIAAIGSVPAIPDIPGIDGANVHQAIDVFRDPSLAKGKTVIIGAGFVGTELAVYLKEEFGIESEIIEMLGEIGDGGNHTHRTAVIDIITRREIPIHFNTSALEITADGVKCQGPDGEVFYKADTVIHAVGMKPLQEEAMEFIQCADTFHAVGECRKAANILFATHSAYAAAKYLGRYL